MLQSTRRHAIRSSSTLVVATLLSTCGGGDPGPTGPDPIDPGGTAGSFTVFVTGSPVSLQPGTSGTVTVSAVRTGGFTGDIALTVANAPTGVTATLAPAALTLTQTSSTLTVNVGASAATGTTVLTVTGTGSGVTHSASVSLVVTAPPTPGPFQLALSVSSYMASPGLGSIHQPKLTITRDPGFTGAVTLSVSGGPPALAIGFTPSSTTGNTSTLVVAQLGVPVGVYDITIRGVAAGGLGERTITLPVTVPAPSTGAITWTFCDNALRWPHYIFAVRDGDGPWTRIAPNDHSYSFDIAQPNTSVAIVTVENGGFRTSVFHYTKAELIAAAAGECAVYASASTRTVNGTVVDLAPGELSMVSMGWWGVSSVKPLGGTVANYSLLNLPAGPLDLFAARQPLNPGSTLVDRVIVRRGLDPASGSSLAAIDYAAAEAVATTPATWTFDGANGEDIGLTQMFLTAGGTAGQLYPFNQFGSVGTTPAVFGVPLAETVAGDLHQITATIGMAGPNGLTRQIVTYDRTLSDRTLTFGPPLAAPNVTVIGSAPTGRVRAQGTLQAEYDDGVALDVSQASIARYASVHATAGYLGSTAYDVAVPDLSAVIGWDATFQLGVGTSATWWVTGGGPSLNGADGRLLFNSTKARWTGARTGALAPADGQVFLFGRASGTITP